MVYGFWRTLFVESCPACDGASEGGFCAVCAADFVRVRDACPRCGLTQPVSQCPRTRAPWNVDAVLAPFSYAPPLDYYVQALKYRGARTLGRAFALLLLPAARVWLADVDALVAVPVHRKRRRERGYNQAQEIARTLASALRLPAFEHGIERQAGTPTQTGQSAGARRVGLAHAFRVTRCFAGQRVAIIDDVVTTGATVNALAAELRASGAARCVVLAVARTPLASRRGTPLVSQNRNV